MILIDSTIATTKRCAWKGGNCIGEDCGMWHEAAEFLTRRLGYCSMGVLQKYTRHVDFDNIPIVASSEMVKEMRDMSEPGEEDKVSFKAANEFVTEITLKAINNLPPSNIVVGSNENYYQYIQRMEEKFRLGCLRRKICRKPKGK